ncbi:MAG TPA: efflux transporter outer membrane subunit [Puia sp.]|nr:efflux transporter outer membrane subunit [Puia sp.]
MRRLLAAITILLIGSCVTQKYQSPGLAVSGQLFRDTTSGTTPSADTTTIATLPYTSLFADTVLLGLIEEGLRENPDLKVAIQRMNEAGESFQQSRAALLPDLSANATVNPTKLSAAAQDIPPAYIGQYQLSTTLYQISLTSTWEADIWGKLKSARRSAFASYLQTDAARRAIRTQLIADIANDYYLLLSYDEQLRITLQTISYRQDDVSTLKALKESGLANGAEVVQSEANRASAELLVPDLKQNIRETENALCLLLGRASGEIKRATLAEQTPYLSLQTGVPSGLMKNRPDVQEAELAFRAAFENVNVAKTYFYPQLTITAQGGYSNLTIKDFFLNSIFYNLVGGLTQPILNKRLNKTRLRVAQAQQKEAFFTYQKTLLTAGMETSNSLYSYQTALEKQTIRRDQIKNLEKAVDFTKELLRYSSNTNYTDVLTSEQSLLSAQLNNIADRLQQLQAVVNLYKALGGGWR